MASIVTTRYTDPTADAMALIMRRVLGTLSVEFGRRLQRNLLTSVQ